MLLDSSDNLYIGFSEFGSYYDTYFQKFSPIGLNPTSSPYLNYIKQTDRNPESGAHTLVFAPGNTGILASGSFYNSLTSFSIGFAYIEASTGIIKYIYAA